MGFRNCMGPGHNGGTEELGVKPLPHHQFYISLVPIPFNLMILVHIAPYTNIRYNIILLCAVQLVNKSHLLSSHEELCFLPKFAELLTQTRQRCWTISSREILETRVFDYNRSLTLRCFQGVVLCALCIC